MVHGNRCSVKALDVVLRRVGRGGAGASLIKGSMVSSKAVEESIRLEKDAWRWCWWHSCLSEV